MEYTDEERDLLLAVLLELKVTRSAFDDDPQRDLIPIVAIPPEQIEALVVKLGGEPDAVFFGAYPDSLGAALVLDTWLVVASDEHPISNTSVATTPAQRPSDHKSA